MKKTILTPIIAVVLSIAGDAKPSTEIVDGIEWTYTILGSEVTIGDIENNVGANHAIPSSTSGAIAIPSTLGGYPVTAIGNSAFGARRGLTSVTIPDSVRSIGASAFTECSGITSMTIPESVTNIGHSAFNQCTSLSSVTIPESAACFLPD